MPTSPRAHVDPFATAGKAAGLEVWRIENLAPVPVDTKLHGKFHVGDAYIVLKTIVEKSGALTWYAFFWLGDESSSDEQGAAALLTVELDTKLGGGPVQSREVQGLESDRFMQCFTAVQYLAGGVDSGFKHVGRYKDWRGAFRGEYSAATQRWDVYAPIWHGGQGVNVGGDLA
jgi:hypothetical protein